MPSTLCSLRVNNNRESKGHMMVLTILKANFSRKYAEFKVLAILIIPSLAVRFGMDINRCRDKIIEHRGA